MIDRTLRVGQYAVALFLILLFVIGAANGAFASGKHAPATRAWAAKTIVDRALLEDVTHLERARYWVGSQCHGDLAGLPKSLRRKICYVTALGFMGSTNRVAEYPTFEPRPGRKCGWDHPMCGLITRGQAASIMWRLGTYGEDAPPDHAASFIDVHRDSPHADAVRWAAFWGIVEGYEPKPGEAVKFHPNRPVTRRQFRRMLARVTVHWATEGQVQR